MSPFAKATQMRAVFRILTLVATMLSNIALADEESSVIVENTYRNAVVKIDVTSNTAVIRDEVNICHSEGTGFLVNRTDVITAAHVFEIDKACGDPIIFVKSRKHGLKVLATVVAASDDVAVLRIDPTKAVGYFCSLVLMPPGDQASRGFRFGIPEGLEDPDPVSLSIGEADNQFKPLIILKPATTHPGESGGPVLRRFNVVGITQARLEKFPDVSFMIGADTIIRVLQKNGIQYDTSQCNPALFATTIPIAAPAQGTPPQDTPDDEIQGSIFSNDIGANGVIAMFSELQFRRPKYAGEFCCTRSDYPGEPVRNWLMFQFTLNLPDDMRPDLRQRVSHEFGQALELEIKRFADPEQFIVDFDGTEGLVTVRSRKELGARIKQAATTALGDVQDQWWENYLNRLR